MFSFFYFTNSAGAPHMTTPAIEFNAYAEADKSLVGCVLEAAHVSVCGVGPSYLFKVSLVRRQCCR